MFTGIVRQLAKVTDIKRDERGLELSIAKPDSFIVSVGDSISINGVCSTVTTVDTSLTFQYMPESIERSNLASLSLGDMVNLEQSLLASDRLDGHVVQGHVDTTANITSIKDEGNSKVITLSCKDCSLIAEKGAVTLEGVSLTVVSATKDTFSVKIIPHTWENTNFKDKAEGDALNVEFDILAKYVQQLIKNHAD